MPASQKARKKPRRPQQISEKTWLAIEKAVVAGMGYSACARQFGVSVFAIMMRSKRNKWPVGSRIQRRVQALQEARYMARECYKSYDEQRHSNAQTIETLAQTWVEKGEQHRILAFDLAHASLEAAAKRGLPIESWRDASLADVVARRNAGLEDSEAHNVSIGMALINYRLEHMHLPKALPE